MIAKPEFVACKTRHAALKACPWAVATTKVEGGYLCFASQYARRIWKKQK